MKDLKNYFLTGLISIVPVVVTSIIIINIAELLIRTLTLERLINYISLKFFPKDKIMHFVIFSIIYKLTIIIILIGIVFIGFIVTHIIRKKEQEIIESVFMKIPIAKTIYSGVKQIINVIFSKRTSAYKRVLLVEYPREGIYSVGFLTSGDVKFLYNSPEKMVNVFIPTSPNPVTGVLVAIPKKKVIPTKMKREEAIKLIVSGGILGKEINVNYEN